MIFSVSKHKIHVIKLRKISFFRENAFFYFPLYNAVEECYHHSDLDIVKIHK